MSRGKRRGATIAAAPINNPGMSAVSTIAAPAATTPRVATLPTTPGPKNALGNQPRVGMKDVAKRFSIVNIAVQTAQGRESVAAA
jgi:hypothetical protein